MAYLICLYYFERFKELFDNEEFKLKKIKHKVKQVIKHDTYNCNSNSVIK